jgi:hypothetical protein
VGNDEGGAAFHEALEGLLDDALGGSGFVEDPFSSDMPIPSIHLKPKNLSFFEFSLKEPRQSSEYWLVAMRHKDQLKLNPMKIMKSIQVYLSVVMAVLLVAGCTSVTEKEEPIAKNSNPFQQGLVAYFPFNGNALDQSGNKNHGVVYGATLTTDRHGNEYSAYQFDGDDYIDIGNDSSLRITEGTISAWIYSEDFGSYSGVVSYISQYHKPLVGGGGYCMGVRSDALTFILAGDRYYENFRTSVDPANISEGKWHHIVLTFGGMDTVRGYVDGKKVWEFHYEKALTVHFNTRTTGQIGTFCNYREAKNLLCKGAIDDVRIFNRVLEESKVLELFQAEASRE